MKTPSQLTRLCSLLALAAAGALANENDAPVPLAPVRVSSGPDKAPLTVVSDPGATLQPMPAQDGADALRNVPGISVIRKGGTDGDPVLRGAAGSRLGVLLDGENILGGCGNRMDPPTAYVFPSAFDKVTVLKGPQSVIYGPGNSAGVVLFEREEPHFASPALKGEASLVLGSFGRNDEFAELQAGGPAGFLRLTGTRTEAGNYEDGSGRSISSSYRRWSSHAAAGLKPGANSSIELTAVRSDGEAAYADRTMDGVRFARENVGARLRAKELGTLIEAAELYVFYNYIDHVMDNYSLRSFTPSSMMPNKSVSNPDRRTVGGRGTLTLAPSETLTLKVGADHQYNLHSVRSSSNQTASDYATLARKRDARFRQSGLFGELTWQNCCTGRFIGGLRSDFWKASDDRTQIALGMMGSMPNPTAGQTRKRTLGSAFLRYEHELPSQFTLFAGLGAAQRFPDYWELFNKESTTGLSAFGTRPERNTQLDFGVLRRSGKWQGSLSAFVSRVDDLILIQSGVLKPGSMGSTRSTTVSRNVDAESAGLELSLMLRLSEHWRAEGSVAYVRGDNRSDGLPLAQMPPLEAKLSLDYTQQRFSAGALVRSVAAQTRQAPGQGNIVGQDIGPSAGFSVLSINGSWRFSSKVIASAGIDNLLDRSFAEHLSRGGAMVTGFPAPSVRVNEPGRNCWVKVSLKY